MWVRLVRFSPNLRRFKDFFFQAKKNTPKRSVFNIDFIYNDFKRNQPISLFPFPIFKY